MKNYILLSVFLMCFAGFSFGQTWTWNPTDSLRIDTAAATSSSTYELIFHTQNTTADTLFCRWKRIYPGGVIGIPLNWGKSMCDPYACYNNALINYAHNYIIKPHLTGTMQFGATPLCEAGSGEVDILTWVVTDSANTATILHYFFNITTPSCINTGISAVEATQISMYPNPVKNMLTVTIPQSMNNTKLDVYNLIGSKVYSKDFNNRETQQDFDLSPLDGGIYVARISENGKILTTRRFNKVD